MYGSGCLLAITPDAVRRPVAEAIVTILHALSTRLYDKDRLVRTATGAGAPPCLV